MSLRLMNRPALNRSPVCLSTLIIFTLSIALSCCQIVAQERVKPANDDDKTMRVFIFAGQSNMVGSDSKVSDIKRFPPFAGLEEPQVNVKFSYCLGRENKTKSEGWVDLAPVNNIVGPELSFARKLSKHIKAPIAIIKCAAGGTHLGGDWNPDDPQGFKMYPLALELIRESLADLDKQGIPYRIEGFMWHQGENDMFVKDYMPNYGKNLKNFIAIWRQDLKTPQLKFYLGELCTKTIWGMDLRPRMHAISVGQKSVASADPLTEYIPTSHVGVEIGGGVGLHYHYGTLGQLEHGVNYADAYLRTIKQSVPSTEQLSLKANGLDKWPYEKGNNVKLFVLAGHRNMEGERAFVQDLEKMQSQKSLLIPKLNVAYKYSLGGGYLKSNGWEKLRPAGYYDTFGPEVSFANALSASYSKSNRKIDFAVAKFTHSGTQMIDWTPEGSMAKTRNIYPAFIKFVKQSIEEVTDHGNDVELAIFYHVGENDMSFHPYRKAAPQRLQALVEASRKDLDLPDLKWYVTQQPPTDDKQVNSVDVVAGIEAAALADKNMIHVKAFDLPKQEKKLVLDTKGVIALGELMAKAYQAEK